jgi:dephospho-CoA kinase
MTGLPMPKLPKPKNAMDRIAFAGPMCVGKTTLATGLASKYRGYTKVSFASRLKALAYSLYGVQGKDNLGRKLLQELADDLKKWDKDLFIKHFLLNAQKEITNGFDMLVVDDLRFKAEEEALRRNGFVIIKVTCNEEVRQERIKTLYPDTSSDRLSHPSEKGWESMVFDYTVDSTTILAHYDLDVIITNGNSNSIYRKK